MYDFECMVSIYDLIDNCDFKTLCQILNVDIQSEWLENEYDNYKRGQGDVLLFQSQLGCIVLDLFQEPTDQNEMIVVGIRCNIEMCAKIKGIVEAICKEAPVKSHQVNEGIAILDRMMSYDRYPVERPTITDIDGKETYKYFQKLRLFNV